MKKENRRKMGRRRGEKSEGMKRGKKEKRSRAEEMIWKGKVKEKMR